MRIDPKHTTVIPVAPKVSRDLAPATASEKSSRTGDVVSLSPAGAAMVERAKSPVSDRIEHLKALVARGEYKVDVDLLASRIVDDELARGGS